MTSVTPISQIPQRPYIQSVSCRPNPHPVKSNTRPQQVFRHKKVRQQPTLWDQQCIYADVKGILHIKMNRRKPESLITHSQHTKAILSWYAVLKCKKQASPSGNLQSIEFNASRSSRRFRDSSLISQVQSSIQLTVALVTHVIDHIVDDLALGSGQAGTRLVCESHLLWRSHTCLAELAAKR